MKVIDPPLLVCLMALGCQGSLSVNASLSESRVVPQERREASGGVLLPGSSISIEDAVRESDCIVIGKVSGLPGSGRGAGETATRFTFRLSVKLALKSNRAPKVWRCRVADTGPAETMDLSRRTLVALGRAGADGTCEVVKMAEPTRENVSRVAPDYRDRLLGALEQARDHFQWAWLSNRIEEYALTVPSTRSSARVKFLLVELTGSDLQRRDRLMQEIVDMGRAAVPVLLAGIRDYVRPRPFYSNSAVANIPIFSMWALRKLKTQEAIPILIDMIDEYRDHIGVIINGEEFSSVVYTLQGITGEKIGKDSEAWRRWHESVR